MDALLTWMQWPAMALTVAATWLVASRDRSRRRAAFWLYLVSNAMWVAWGLHSEALALVVLQFCLAALNVRGARKADTDKANKSDEPEPGSAA
jgi:hypothetical protein